MKKIFLLLAILISPILALNANAGSNSGNYIFSLGHKGVQGKEQVLFNSFATEEVAEGQKASINWSLNKLDTSFSILIDGNSISTNEVGDFDFYPEKTTEVTISLFDNAKNKVIEEHDHVISVFGAPKITSLTADSEIVKANSNVVLRWTGENLGTISFSPLAVAINKGSAIVKPSVNTTYVMTATNSMGLFDTKEISIATSEYIPEITSFTIDKQEVYRGQSVNLTWTSKDSESVDFFINGESVQKGLAANGTLSYDATTTGVQSLQLRPKDKYYGLYGLVKSNELTVKESDSWDFLPRLITDASIKTGQSLDFEWAAGASAKSITISYKTNATTDWTVLPITKLAGTYSLPIKENGASTATIKFDLIKSNDALVSSSITGSLITTAIDKTRLSSGSPAVLSVSQGINYPLSVYVDDVKSKIVYNGASSISLGENAGERVIEIRTNGAGEKVIDTYKVTVLPTWVRTPDLSRSVMYAGDTTVLSWSVAEPFVSASVKRTSDLGVSTIDRLAASGTMTDTLVAGETYVNYDVTVTTANNESLTSSVIGYLANSAISISEAGFGQDIPVTFLSSTPSKVLYVDGVQKKSLSGTSYNVTGLSVGVHNIEVKSLYGKFPLNNRAYSKEITVLPSDNIEIQSDFVIVETGKGFVWSWYVPEQYDNVEVIESNGATSTVSTANDGTYASEMKSNNGATLTVKASSNGGAVVTKTLSIDAFFISGLLDEYSYTESPYISIYAPGGLSFYINDVLWTGVSGSASFNYTIPYSKLDLGFNKIRFESRSSKSGQKMDITKSLTRLNDITLTLDNNIAPVGGITGASWSVPSEFADVKVTRKVASGVDEVVSINRSGNHSAAMTNSAVVYTIEGTTKLGKKSSTSKTIHYYSVALDAQLDDKASTILTLTSSTNATFYLDVNGQRKSSYSSSTKGISTSISYVYFETGENNLVFEPTSLSGMNFETTISRLSESKNPQKLDYGFVITGEKNTYSWDVTTEYSIVKVTHNNVLVSTENAGSYDYFQSSGIDALSIYTETPDGYSQTKTLSSRDIVQSTTREVADYSSVVTKFYSPYTSGYVKASINGKDWMSWKINGYLSGLSVSPSLLEYGENEITFTPTDDNVMPWTSYIKKLAPVTASANYDIALVGTQIEYEWDIPDEYPSFKIESTVAGVKTTLPNDRSGRFSHIKSDGYSDYLTITATNANGVEYVKTVTVKFLKVVPRANRITASQTYYLDITGTFYGASIYINDQIYSNFNSPNTTIGFGHGSFVTDNVNTIKVVPSGDDGRVAPWSGEVIAFKEPALTSDFDYIAPTDIATYRWDADDSIYETVSITHYVNSVPSVISNEKTGAVDTIKALSDRVIMNAVTFTGEVYNKTIVIKDMDAYVSNPIVYQGVGAQIIIKSYSRNDTFDYYINGNKYVSKMAYPSYYSGVSIPTSELNDGDNEIKVVYSGTYLTKTKDWVFNIEKKPDMVIDSDYEQILVGDNDVTFNWDIPSGYSDLSIKLNDVEVSSSYSGSYTYKPTAHEYIYLKITAKTEEGGAANTLKRVTAYRVEMRPYSNEGNPTKDVEVAESNGPRIFYQSPQSTNAKFFVNGVYKGLISNGSSNALSTNYFQLGENTIEIFTDDVLEDSRPSSKHLYFTGKVSVSKRAIVTSGAPVTIKDNVVSFEWDTFGEYDSVAVKTVINGETKQISTDKSGSFQYTRTSASYDTLSVDVKKGDIEYTVSAGSGGAVYELDKNQVSTSQRTLLKSEMYTYGENVYSEVYVNGVYKNRIESSTRETRYGSCCNYPRYYVWVKKSNTNSYIEPSWLNSGENEIQIKLYNDSYPVQVWTSSITKVETPVITAEIDLLHIGEVATFSWNAEDAFNDVKVTLKKDGVLMDISDENSGSYSFIKEKGTDTIYITATGDDGLSYSTSRQIYYMSVLFPAVVASGQSVSYYYESSYPSAQVYINGVSIKTMSASGLTYTAPASYFNVGDNVVEVVQTGSFAATTKKWEGKVIVTEAPEFTVNYNMMHIGDVVTVNWDAPSIYETVTITRSNSSGVEVLSDNASSGTVSYIKEAMDDTISISASNGSGATYSASHVIKYMSVLFPATIEQGLDAAYTFKSSDGKAKVYVNDVLIITINGTGNVNYAYSIPKSNLHIGNNKIEVLSSGASVDSAKAWIGNVIVTE